MPACQSKDTCQKRATRFSVFAKDDVTGHTERIFGNFGHLSHIGRPNIDKKKPYHKSVVTHNHDVETLKQIIREQDAHIKNLAHLSNLVSQVNLIDRISSETTLLERLSDPKPPSYTPPKPLPKGIRFRKARIISREEEYTKLIEGTGKRLDFIRHQMLKREVKFAYEEGMEKLLENFDNLRDSWKKLADTYKDHQWIWFKKDCKAVGRVKFNNIEMEKRWREVCSELAALGGENRFDLF